MPSTTRDSKTTLNPEMAKLAQENMQRLQELANKQGDHMEDFAGLAQSYTNMVSKLWGDPDELFQLQMKLYQNYLNLWSNMTSKLMGEEVQPVALPQKGDRRFSSEQWDQNWVFDFIKQSYLVTYDTVIDSIHASDNLDKAEKAKTSFYARQFLDAMSPTNFPLTNPDVLQKTLETNGENLVKGLNNLLNDLQRGDGQLKISMTDYDAFEVGKNLATTPGEVVFRNDLIEIIQYTPTTEKVHAKPILIAPPWINRYYILDLREKNSFVKYAVEQGFQTFLISWRNVEASQRDANWETYLAHGLEEAIDAVLEITGQKDLNMLGYCIGGTLLSSLLAVHAKKKDKRINSATFFTTLIDFSEAGELGVFIDEDQVKRLEAKMKERGYLDGSEMAATFSLLRANDLIWSFVVNNYLMGETPFPFDILFWNDDPTRLPAAMHSFYLRNMYLQNNLVKKDKLEFLGEKVDIGQIDLPTYFVSAVNDHITPWTGCFAPLKKFKQAPRFVLSKAGHVAGVVNPPGSGKRAYWADTVKDLTPKQWHEQAEFMEDSWWPDWSAWLAKQSGAKVVAPKKAGSTKHKSLGQAPGKYVLEK